MFKRLLGHLFPSAPKHARPWLGDPLPYQQQTVGDVDDLTAVATAVGVLHTPAPTLDEHTPTGLQPPVEFDCESIHPAFYGWLSDAALERGIDYCWKTS